MGLEVTLRDLLKAETGKDVFWNSTTEGYKVTAPVIILQQVGGKAYRYVNNDGPAPSHKHARIQVSVMGRMYLDVITLSRQVEDILAASNIISEPYGAAVVESEPDLSISVANQQFGMWFVDP